MKQLYKSSLILVILTFALRILAQEPYCTPIYNTGCTYGDGLILFQLGDINQQIQCDGSLFPWYHDYTSISTVIQIDSQYTLTVQSGNSSTYLRVWIDFKNDELFDSAELVVDNLLLSSSQTNFTAPVKIPAGTLPGNHRLRYRTDWLFGVTGACATLEYGNSCDFTLKASPVGIQEFEEHHSRCYPNPSSDRLHIELDQNVSGEVLIEMSDIYGKIIKSIVIPERPGANNTFQLSVNDLPSGLYFYSVTTTHNRYDGKITVVH